MTEIDKLKKEIVSLKKLVFKDPLTGLYNRRGFLEAGRKIFGAAISNKGNFKKRKNYLISSLSLIFCDLDNFKKINDTFGHLAGDKVLKYFSDFLCQSVRSSDLVCRWGGEEFVIMLVGADLADALNIAENLRKEIEARKISISCGKKVSITSSFGIAEINGAKDLEDLVFEADEAMYKAKKQGKNAVVAL